LLQLRNRNATNRGFAALNQKISQLEAELQRSKRITLALQESEQKNIHLNEELEQRVLTRTDELRQAMDKLVQVEKMKSVGQLAAGIAHEINTPLQYIGDNLRFLSDSFKSIQQFYTHHEKLINGGEENAFARTMISDIMQDAEKSDIIYIIEEIPAAIMESLSGVEKTSRIVAAMKEFSHPGQDEKSLSDINKMLISTITVARNEWKYVAELDTSLEEELPLVMCHSSINQVFLNMIVNAAHSIAEKLGENSVEKGQINVATYAKENYVEIRIADTGCGIAQEQRSKVFEPFYTTKEIGKGTGQGLSISHNIIVGQHQGTIEVESEVGLGTTFIIKLSVDGKELT